jgi:hypothetical protein
MLLKPGGERGDDALDCGEFAGRVGMVTESGSCGASDMGGGEVGEEVGEEEGGGEEGCCVATLLRL